MKVQPPAIPYCDNHGDEKVRATHEDVEVMVGDSGVRLIDLCNDCYERILAPMEAILPFGTPKATRPKPSAARASGSGVKTAKCPICGTPSVNRKALGQHMRQTHKASIKDYSRRDTTLNPE